MIGQKLFNSYLDNWQKPPQFIILNGEEGSGRSTLVELIKHKFKYQSIICGTSAEEVREVVTMSYTISSPTFYIFYNGDKLSVSAKNSLLKVVEEQPQNAFFIMRTEFGVMETLKNRSFYYNMQPYSFLELKEYFCSCGKQELFSEYGKICKNIGQIKTFLNSPYEEIIDYCTKIITIIREVSQGNIFNISTKLNFGEDLNKWDTTLFINILEWVLNKKYIETKDDKYFQAIFRLNNVKSSLRINGVNKQVVFDNFLLGLKYLL